MTRLTVFGSPRLKRRRLKSKEVPIIGPTLLEEHIVALRMSLALMREGVTVTDKQLVLHDPVLLNRFAAVLLDNRDPNPLEMLDADQRVRLIEILAKGQYFAPDPRFDQLVDLLLVDSCFEQIFDGVTTREIRVLTCWLGMTKKTTASSIAIKCGVSNAAVPRILERCLRKLHSGVHRLVMQFAINPESYNRSFKTMQIETLDFSDRVLICLRRAGIHSIAGLMSWTEDNLLALDSFGAKCLEEVKSKLGHLGLSLRVPTKL